MRQIQIICQQPVRTVILREKSSEVSVSNSRRMRVREQQKRVTDWLHLALDRTDLRGKKTVSVLELLLAWHFPFRRQLCGSYRMASNGRRIPGDIRMWVMFVAVRWPVLCLVVLTAVIFQRSTVITVAGEDWSVTGQ